MEAILAFGILAQIFIVCLAVFIGIILPLWVLSLLRRMLAALEKANALAAKQESELQYLCQAVRAQAANVKLIADNLPDYSAEQ